MFIFFLFSPTPKPYCLLIYSLYQPVKTPSGLQLQSLSVIQYDKDDHLAGESGSCKGSCR